MGKRLQMLTDNYFVMFNHVPGLVSANCFSLVDKWHFDATINISRVRLRLHCDGKQHNGNLRAFSLSSYLHRDSATLSQIVVIWTLCIPCIGCDFTPFVLIDWETRDVFTKSANHASHRYSLCICQMWAGATALQVLCLRRAHTIVGELHTLRITYDVISLVAGVH